MNTGIITSHYSLALMKLVDADGSADMVARQVTTLLQSLERVPDLQKVLDDRSAVPFSGKLSLFDSALAPGSLCPQLRDFLSLVIRNGRSSEVKLIFKDFLSRYYKSRNIKVCRLVTAAPSEELVSRLVAALKDSLGGEIVVETAVDPKIIGGFILEVDDYMVDASVRRRIDTVRNQFIEKNRRIV